MLKCLARLKVYNVNQLLEILTSNTESAIDIKAILVNVGSGNSGPVISLWHFYLPCKCIKIIYYT